MRGEHDGAGGIGTGSGRHDVLHAGAALGRLTGPRHPSDARVDAGGPPEFLEDCDEMVAGIGVGGRSERSWAGGDRVDVFAGAGGAEDVGGSIGSERLVGPGEQGDEARHEKDSDQREDTVAQGLKSATRGRGRVANSRGGVHGCSLAANAAVPRQTRPGHRDRIGSDQEAGAQLSGPNTS